MSDKKHTCASLMRAWEDRPKGLSASDTSDPVLLAGCYLEWAGGKITKALNAVSTLCTGQYLDRPRFSGCDETKALLEAVQAAEQASAV